MLMPTWWLEFRYYDDEGGLNFTDLEVDGIDEFHAEERGRLLIQERDYLAVDVELESIERIGGNDEN